jgi:hypothetical protein
VPDSYPAWVTEVLPYFPTGYATFREQKVENTHKKPPDTIIVYGGGVWRYEYAMRLMFKTVASKVR